ncbi:MAG: EF-P beta-lysylation protein EpmB [Steroidobacteraceae bacterium]
MIAASSIANQPDAAPRADWQRALADAISDPRELLSELDLAFDAAAEARLAARSFPLRVPRSFVRRMRRGDAQDPLLLQILPLGAELDRIAGYTFDPVQDLAHRTAPGLLHKYHGRALLIATGACAVHCRYCFRRHFPYGDESAVGSQWQQALAQIEADASIGEIILSGGDPLSLSDQRLQRLTDDLRRIPHVRRLRVHTRYPIVLPERVNDGLGRWLRNLPWPVVVVVHTNHANEIDAEVVRACKALRDSGATVLNQAVLLARVNDSTDALVDLSEKLFAAGVLPYYLHLLDRVQGAAHFEVAESRARQLVSEVRARLPGYLVPQLVREIAGELSKTPIAP